MTNAILLIVMLAPTTPKLDAHAQAVFTSVLKSEHKSEVTPRKVCAIQHAIKLRKTPAWSLVKCEEVAADFSKAKERGVPPVLPFSMSINESDLREDRSSPALFKTYPFYFKGKKRLKVQDHGLMGVRCVEDKGVCINVPVVGMTPKKLREPSANIQAGVTILLRKKKVAGSTFFWEPKWLLHYNGNTKNHDNGYAGRISAIAAAINGVQLKVATPRMEKLTGQIISAVRELDSPELASR